MTDKLTKEYIIETCEKYNIKKYTINDDLSINVDECVKLNNSKLKKIPLMFNEIMGSFYCNNNKLTSLKGAPRKCYTFYCNNNKLTSLEGAPEKCEMLICSGNDKLYTLKYAPKCGYIVADYNKLDLDKEELCTIKAIVNYNLVVYRSMTDKRLLEYYNMRSMIENRNNIINSILDN